VRNLITRGYWHITLEDIREIIAERTGKEPSQQLLSSIVWDLQKKLDKVLQEAITCHLKK